MTDPGMPTWNALARHLRAAGVPCRGTRLFSAFRQAGHDQFTFYSYDRAILVAPVVLAGALDWRAFLLGDAPRGVEPSRTLLATAHGHLSTEPPVYSAPRYGVREQVLDELNRAALAHGVSLHHLVASLLTDWALRYDGGSIPIIHRQRPRRFKETS